MQFATLKIRRRGGWFTGTLRFEGRSVPVSLPDGDAQFPTESIVLQQAWRTATREFEGCDGVGHTRWARDPINWRVVFAVASIAFLGFCAFVTLRWGLQ